MTDRADRPGASAVFHEKRTYRKRRLMDAAKVMPVLAIFLWCVPLIWPQSGDGAVTSATALVYIFGAWTGLIILTWILSLALRHTMDEGSDAEP